jgi:hypothetical protein
VRRIAGVISWGVVGLVVAACSGSAEPEVTVATTVPPTTTTTVVESTTTVAPAATTTTTVVSEPPIPDTSGDDWTKIMTELYELANWLYEYPDSSLLEYIVVPGSEADVNFGGVIRQYEADGWSQLPGGGSEIREVALQAESGGRAVVLVVSDFDGSTAVDVRGTVVREEEDQPVRATLWTMELGEDQRWRVVEVDQLGPIEGFED